MQVGPSAAVTVYVVVAAGETVMLAVVAPVLHKYPKAPLAVSVALAPRQIVSGDGVIEAAGAPPTATVPTAVAEQPLAKVTVKL